MGDNVVTLMQDGLRHESQGNLQEAVECYSSAIIAMHREFASRRLASNEASHLLEYMSTVMKKVRVIRQQLRAGDASSEAASTPSATIVNRPHGAPGGTTSNRLAPPPAHGGASAGGEVDDIDVDLIANLRPTPSQPIAGRSSGNTSANPSRGSNDGQRPAQPPATPSRPTPSRPPQPPSSGEGGGNSLPPPNFTQPAPLSNYFAPRTSELVLKAIDIAASLSRQKEYKRAVDVLQHAYDLGKRDRNNPRNFNRIEEALVMLRKEYYNNFRPRFLQENAILPEEMEILRKSGITSTILLPIWDDIEEGYGAENVFMPSEGPWVDSFTPALSKKQQKHGAQLVRAPDIKRGVELSIIKQANPLNIKQTVVGDCSMVCSLIVCSSMQMRFPNAKIISNVIFPQDTNGDPIVNPKGKYCVKMLINGITRLITVDDRLPANPRTGEMLCTYSKDPSELWVSIMEKAFVKVCGGTYDFPGSSSSSDLYKLSGWLPDGFDFRAEDFDPAMQWARLATRHGEGAVLATLSTPPSLPEIVEKNLKLYAGHAYAVLDFREVDGLRLVQIKNPWSVTTWSGLFSIDDQRNGPKVLEQLGHTEELAAQGIFWMSWADVVKYFSRCSLSWNPYMLFRTPDGKPRKPTRLACHGIFTPTQCIGQQPQYHIQVQGAPKWNRMHLVISRHITDVSEFGLQFQKDDDTVPFIALQIFNVTPFPSVAQCLSSSCKFGLCLCRRIAHGTELSRNFKPIISPIYRNIAAQTVSFDCPPGNSHFVVSVARTDSPVKTPFNFTLTLHTELDQIKLTGEMVVPTDVGVFMHAIPTHCLKNYSLVKGEWKRGVSCGGKSVEQTFVCNPQYLLKLLAPSLISLRLCVRDCKEAAQVQLVRKNRVSNKVPWGARVSSLSTETSMAMQAPMYAYGGTVLDSSLRDCLVYDTGALLGTLPSKQMGKVAVKVAGQEATTFSITPVSNRTVADIVFVAALAGGVMLAPNHSKIVYNGAALDGPRPFGAQGIDFQQTPSIDFILVTGPKVVVLSSGCSAIVKDIVVAAKEALAQLVGDGVTNMPSKARELAAQVAALQPALEKAGADGAEQVEGQNCLLQACAFLAFKLGQLQSSSSPKDPSTVLLPPLPAGEYTIIPSLWTKGVPATFELHVETTEKHEVSLIPQEGDGYVSQVVQAQLKRSSDTLPDTRGGGIPKTSTYFHTNVKISIVPTKKGVFCARALILTPLSADEDTGSIPDINISLFRSREGDEMAMVSSPAPYLKVGAAVEPVEVEPQYTYLLVLSSQRPSDAKVAVRMFSPHAFVARLM